MFKTSVLERVSRTCINLHEVWIMGLTYLFNVYSPQIKSQYKECQECIFKGQSSARDSLRCEGLRLRGVFLNTTCLTTVLYCWTISGFIILVYILNIYWLLAIVMEWYRTKRPMHFGHFYILFVLIWVLIIPDSCKYQLETESSKPAEIWREMSVNFAGEVSVSYSTGIFKMSWPNG